MLIWSPERCGQFLDAVELGRLYAMWRPAAYWELRRGEPLRPRRASGCTMAATAGRQGNANVLVVR